DERRGGRDVEGLAAVAARARGVDEIGARRLDRHDVRAHRLGRAGDLRRRLALDPQRDQEAADLPRRRLAGHDRVHHVARLLARPILAVEELCEGVLDHPRTPCRKFSAMSRPFGVSTDSGWNCTPLTASSRWRTAITSPSTARADTSNTSGTLVAA